MSLHLFVVAHFIDSQNRRVAIIVSCLGSFRALFSRQDSRKPGPQRSLIHASKNVFLRGTKRVHPSDQSISLTGLRDDSGHYSTYIRTGDSEQGDIHLDEPEHRQQRASNNIVVKSRVDVGHLDGETQTPP